MDFTEKQEDVDVADAEVVSADDLYDTDADMRNPLVWILSDETSEAICQQCCRKNPNQSSKSRVMAPPLPEQVWGLDYGTMGVVWS